MFSCRQVTRLISDRQERSLSWFEGMGVGVHLLGCEPCRRFHRAVRWLHRALASALIDDVLPLEARQRIRVCQGEVHYASSSAQCVADGAGGRGGGYGGFRHRQADRVMERRGRQPSGQATCLEPLAERGIAGKTVQAVDREIVVGDAANMGQRIGTTRSLPWSASAI
jgi:hypothetical protein